MKDSRPVRQGGVIMSGGSGITSRRGLFAAAGAALLASATACSGAGDTQALGEPGDGQQTTLMVFRSEERRVGKECSNLWLSSTWAFSDADSLVSHVPSHS